MHNEEKPRTRGETSSLTAKEGRGSAGNDDHVGEGLRDVGVGPQTIRDWFARLAVGDDCAGVMSAAKNSERRK